MRILYNSKLPAYKRPFGTLTPGQTCALRLDVPSSEGATHITVKFTWENGCPAWESELHFARREGAYDIFQGSIACQAPGLYYYYFYVHKRGGGFRLFKYGDDTNMEAGDCWQLSCIPADFVTPDWAKGAVIYQVFPDRFCKAGECDLTGKLRPYTLHKSWDEEVSWQPAPDGQVLNNDFYGGNFRGIAQKMDYIASLGATILYLNPISKSFSSHRYDTGDYLTPDPMLGTVEDFTAMCDAAHARGIKVILDGVYSHTGSNSLYFNREGAFGAGGAYRDASSPYKSWYTFYNYPGYYKSWWNFDTLPTVNKLDGAFMDYIIENENSVVTTWLRRGADGFRLDVADELPDEFLSRLKRRIRQVKPDALLMGEVWEDASNKIAYDRRRRYFVDGQLDSVMNYPFRTAILNFMRDRDDGRALKQTVMAIVENYPPQVLSCCMNLLGTHDTPRILTALVEDFDGSREAMARRRLSKNQLEVAKERLIMASFLQYMLPGSPSLYYGDEAVMQGHRDPFNRRTYPWGKEDGEMLDHFRCLGKLRKESQALRLGDIRFAEAGDQHLAFTRSYGGETVHIYINRSGDPWEVPAGRLLLGHNIYRACGDAMILSPMGFCITQE